MTGWTNVIAASKIVSMTGTMDATISPTASRPVPATAAGCASHRIDLDRET